MCCSALKACLISPVICVCRSSRTCRGLGVAVLSPYPLVSCPVVAPLATEVRESTTRPTMASSGVVLWGDKNLPWSERSAEIHVEGLEFAPAAAISSRAGRFVQLQEDGSSAFQPPEDSGAAEQHASQPLPGFSCPHKVLFFLTYLLYIAVNTVNGPLMPAMKVSLNFTSNLTLTKTNGMHPNPNPNPSPNPNPNPNQVSLNFTSGEGATIAAVQTVSTRPPRLRPRQAPKTSATRSPRPAPHGPQDQRHTVPKTSVTHARSQRHAQPLVSSTRSGSQPVSSCMGAGRSMCAVTMGEL
eukprot:scaffold38416_cov50-Phaeocystis_antarctica.AAC.2